MVLVPQVLAKVSLLEDLRSGGWPDWAPMPKAKGRGGSPRQNWEGTGAFFYGGRTNKTWGRMTIR